MVSPINPPTLRILATPDMIKIEFFDRNTQTAKEILAPVGDQECLSQIYDLTTRLDFGGSITGQEARTIRESLIFEGKLNPSYHSGNCDYFPDWLLLILLSFGT